MIWVSIASSHFLFLVSTFLVVKIDQPASISCCHGFTTIINLSLHNIRCSTSFCFLILSLFDHLFLFFILLFCFWRQGFSVQHWLSENSSGDQAALKFRDLANSAFEVLMLNVWANTLTFLYYWLVNLEYRFLYIPSMCWCTELHQHLDF